jgi:phage virion morphogenesis protein
MGTEVKINFEAFNLARQVLTNFGKPEAINEILGEIGVYVERKIDERFETQTDPDGRPWTPLAASTLRQKRTRTILQETGNLRRSINSQIAGETITFTAEADYAGYQQQGASNIPSRVFLGLSEQSEEEVAEIVFANLARRL